MRRTFSKKGLQQQQQRFSDDNNAITTTTENETNHTFKLSRSQLIESIQRLAPHIPEVVLRDLAFDDGSYKNHDNDTHEEAGDIRHHLDKKRLAISDKNNKFQSTMNSSGSSSEHNLALHLEPNSSDSVRDLAITSSRNNDNNNSINRTSLLTRSLSKGGFNIRKKLGTKVRLSRRRSSNERESVASSAIDASIQSGVSNFDDSAHNSVSSLKGLDYSTRRQILLNNVSRLDGLDFSLDSQKEITDDYRYAKRLSALLFVDISGFTNLATSLDVESLSTAINSYFDQIVTIVTDYGGDIIKFAGDAIFAEWRVHDDESDVSISEVALVAARCGAEITEKCSDYEIHGNASNASSSDTHSKSSSFKMKVYTLDVHCGIGVGELSGVHVGNSDINRREYLILGNPIDQVAKAEAVAQHGEVVASPEALQALKGLKGFKVLNQDLETFVVLARRKLCYFDCEDVFLSNHADEDNLADVDRRCLEMSDGELEEFRKKLMFYVHPTIREDELDAKHHFQPVAKIPRNAKGIPHRRTISRDMSVATLTFSRKRHQAEAELRSVYTMFICPKVDFLLYQNSMKNQKMLKKLNDIMLCVSSILKKNNGHLRQYIVDDKGVVLIATFGLRGSSGHDMISRNAIPATFEIHQKLERSLNVTSTIGATFGKAYCGVVGGVRRHEFAILGPSVNLAARLMANKANSGILVDEAVRLKSGSEIEFEALPPVKAKGYTDLVPIYRPTARVIPEGYFVGRSKEIELILNRVAKITSPTWKSKLKGRIKSVSLEKNIYFITGSNGSGKTFLLNHVTDLIELRCSPQSALFLTGFCSTTDQSIPLSTLGQVLLDLLSLYFTNRRLFEGGSRQALSDSQDISSAVRQSMHVSGLNLESSLAQNNIGDMEVDIMLHLYELSSTLNFHESVADLVLAHFYRIDQGETPLKIVEADERLNKLVENFLVKVLLYCTRKLSLTVISIENVQWIDTLSWKLLRSFVSKQKKIFVLCTLNHMTTTRAANIMQTVCGRSKRESRVNEIRMQPFSFEDTKEFVSESLQCDADQLDKDLINDLYHESKGHPYFLREIMHDITRGDLTKVNDDGTISWLADGSSAFAVIDQYLLERFDSLNKRVRILISHCAVLGSEFTLTNLTRVLPRWYAKLSGRKSNILTVGADGQVTLSDQDLNVVLSLLNEAIEALIIEEKYDTRTSSRRLKNSKNSLPFIHRLSSQPNVSLDSVGESTIESLDLEPSAVDEVDKAHKCAQMNDSPFKSSVGSIEQEQKYKFRHSKWQQVIKCTMLTQELKEINESIAESLEPFADVSSLALFEYWKGSGNVKKSLSLALQIAARFEKFGSYTEAVEIYSDVRKMMLPDVVTEPLYLRDELISNEEKIAISSWDVNNLESLLKIDVSLGYCNECLNNYGKALPHYKFAFEVYNNVSRLQDIEDNEFILTLCARTCALLRSCDYSSNDDLAFELEVIRVYEHEAHKIQDSFHMRNSNKLHAGLVSQLTKATSHGTFGRRKSSEFIVEATKRLSGSNLSTESTTEDRRRLLLMAKKGMDGGTTKSKRNLFYMVNSFRSVTGSQRSLNNSGAESTRSKIFGSRLLSKAQKKHSEVEGGLDDSNGTFQTPNNSNRRQSIGTVGEDKSSNGVKIEVNFSRRSASLQ